MKNEKNGLIFQINNEEELSEQLEKMITEKKLREAIAKESLKLARTTFNVTTINAQLGNIYQSLKS
ncbi:hypothetical protein NXX68_16740 [Bacteroides fragilis]|nr:hypothetical protein [Bacteroides fragilis]